MNTRSFSGLLAAGLLWLVGCTSTQNAPASPADVRLEIELEHTTELLSDRARDYETKTIKAVLRDRSGKAIEDDKIKLLVNDVPMVLRVGVGNYYDRDPYYRVDDKSKAGARLLLPANTDYRFTLIWTDGKRYEAASIRTPAALSGKQFTVPRTQPRGRAMTIDWRDVIDAASAEMTVARQANEPRDAPDAKRRERLASRTGSRTVPASFWAKNGGVTTSALTVTVVVKNEGTVASAVSKQSTVTAVRKLTWDIALVDSKK